MLVRVAQHTYSSLTNGRTYTRACTRADDHSNDHARSRINSRTSLMPSRCCWDDARALTGEPEPSSPGSLMLDRRASTAAWPLAVRPGNRTPLRGFVMVSRVVCGLAPPGGIAGGEGGEVAVLDTAGYPDFRARVSLIRAQSRISRGRRRQCVLRKRGIRS
jgi:hypothetical protein